MSGDLIGIKISQLQSYSGDAPSNAQVPMSVGGQTFKFEGLSLLAKKSDVYDIAYINAALSEKADALNTYTKDEVDSITSGFAESDDVYNKTEIDDKLVLKSDSSDTYSKSEVDDILGYKVDYSSVYIKSEIDTMLDGLVASGDVYSISEINSLLSSKADANNVYSKVETDAFLSDKQDLLDLSGGNQIVYSLDGSTISKIGIKDRGVNLLVAEDDTWGFDESTNGQQNNIWVGDGSPSGEKTSLHSWGFSRKNLDSVTNLRFSSQSSGTDEINLPKSGDIATLEDVNNFSGEVVGLVNSLTQDLNSFIINKSGEPESFYLNDSKQELLKTTKHQFNFSEFGGGSFGVSVGDIFGEESAPYGTVFANDFIGFTSNANYLLNKLKILESDFESTDGEKTWYLPKESGSIASKQYVDSQLSLKADTATTYTQDQIDSIVGDLANANDVYTKVDVDDFLSEKADVDSVYEKDFMDFLLGQKADKSNTYTKAEVDALSPSGATTSLYGITRLATNSATQLGVGSDVVTASSAAATYVPIAGTPASGEVGELLMHSRTSSDFVSLAVSNQYYEVFSLYLSAGTYLVTSDVNINSVGSSPARVVIFLSPSSASSAGFANGGGIISQEGNSAVGNRLYNISYIHEQQTDGYIYTNVAVQFVSGTHTAYRSMRAYRMRKKSF